MAAPRIEFRILGPLAVVVGGTSAAIGGPKQRALLALLLLNANRVVSRDRLVGELFPDQSVNSADHALRNHVSRVRKVLAPAAASEPRLVARSPGYLLRVEPGELDFEHFERLADAGREAAASGDLAAAADAFRTAERLWQGRPLADLELEPFARLEVERLEEVRLAVLEERIDVELELGRQLALVSELESLAEEYPYRERFRAQLMLALYRAGRQAEGLELYRRTRTLLNDELGLEPGVELQGLERAILTQDPRLAPARAPAPPARRPVSDVCPFKGLAPFEAADAPFFFGRERLVDELVGRLAESPFLAITGASGSGKSSLLRAGLLPELGDEAIVVRPGDRSAEELFAAVASRRSRTRAVLAVDQLEELFASDVDEGERRAFLSAVVELAWDPEQWTLVLLALRADFFARLAAYPELADLVDENHVLLGPMSASELRRAVERPAALAGLDVEPDLVDSLVDDVAGETGGLPLLSTALVDLWHDRDGHTLTLAAYERRGGVRGAVGRHAEAAFRSLEPSDQLVARRILLRLVAGGDGEVLTRRRVDRAELGADDDDAVARVLDVLVARRLLVADERTVEVVHEALLERWPRLAEWIDEDTRGHRLRQQLATAAAAWEAAGRDPSELFRGARLAATLEWADGAGADAALNAVERDFLAASRGAATRETRRLRVLLAAALALLLAAVVAGAVALSARGAARHQATSAVAQRLGAQALVEPVLDRSLLLAREAVRLEDSPATRGNLLAALMRSPAALAVAHPSGQRVIDDALDPSGRTLAVRGDDGAVTFFDSRRLGRRGGQLSTLGNNVHFGAVTRQLRALAYSPDGRTLAAGDSDDRHAVLLLFDATTHDKVASATDPAAVVTTDVLYAPDGRTVVTGEAVTGRITAPPLVVVVRRASDGVELRRSAPIRAGRLVGFGPGGRSLLVTSGETVSFLLDLKSFRRLRTYPASGTPAVSAGGRFAVFGGEEGEVRLADLRKGSVRTLGRTPGTVTSLAFAPGGGLFASGSSDGTVVLWDAVDGFRESLPGHAGAAVGLVFSRDGRTLFSGSADGTVIAMDVTGERRLARPFTYAPVASRLAGRRTPGAGTTAVAVSPDGSLFATQPRRDRVTLWRTSDLSVVGELRGPCGSLDSLAFSHDGRFLAAAGDARNTVVWNVRTRRVVKLLPQAADGGASGVNFSPDATLVATAGVDGRLRVYEVRSGRLVANVSGRNTLQDVDFSSDGELVVGAGLGKNVVVWDLRRRRLVRMIDQPDLIFAIRMSPDGRTIATGDASGSVRFWDARSGRAAGRTIGGQNGAATSVTYDPTGTELMTTSSDGKVRLWDARTSKLIGAPLDFSERASWGWGTYFPDGRRVVVVFDSGLGVIWNVDPSAWAAQACRIANRDLTPTEWRDFLPARDRRPVCR